MNDRRAPVTDLDVYVTRAFAASRPRVWQFFTEPELLAQWFGPDMFTVPVETVDIDLKVGGRWNLSMVDAAGNSYPITGRITACEPPEYLEVAIAAQTETGELDHVILRLTFHDHGDTTRMTLHQGPLTDEQREQTLVGWEMSWVALDGILSN
jgi:uncharacterized protein YndB with AHSA1/START domain